MSKLGLFSSCTLTLLWINCFVWKRIDVSFVIFSCSDILAEERQLSQCLVQSSKKDGEFRSIFQHIQNAQLQRSPSELFAQHIVAIVHHIKGESTTVNTRVKNAASLGCHHGNQDPLTAPVFTSSCTGQHFPPCVLTLNERFTMYQKRAAEKEIMKPRKSPEIHR